MVTSVLAELVSICTDLDPLEIGLEAEELVNALKSDEGFLLAVKRAGKDGLIDAIAEAWEDAYDNVVHGNAEYWHSEYGMTYNEVAHIVDANSNRIERKVLSLLK